MTGFHAKYSMWILHFLPDSVILWFCNILLLAGIVLAIAGLFAQRIPVIWQYQLPFKVLGIALLAAGVYFRGGYDIEMTWRERVAEVEKRVAEAEAAAKEANEKLEKKTVERVTAIRNRTEYISRYIDREIVKYDSQCVIPPSFIKAHNDATEAPKK